LKPVQDFQRRRTADVVSCSSFTPSAADSVKLLTIIVPGKLAAVLEEMVTNLLISLLTTTTEKV